MAACVAEQKLDVAQSELHEVGRETDEMKQNSEKLIDTLRVSAATTAGGGWDSPWLGRGTGGAGGDGH